ncbi:MAG: BlaI/MecI/CopY family transcriptional regulator [Roseivirga sp.]|nr:BlaI/MecI/CopY family transcriptional regulator [Roseivirga sp.]
MIDKPTESELEILKVLWSEGPSTVRDVNNALNMIREIGYTTTLKIMQIMTQKGSVQRDETSRTHIYSAAVKEAEIKDAMIDRLMDTAFSGSASQLVMQALGRGKTSPQELEKIKALIEKMEGGES